MKLLNVLQLPCANLIKHIHTADRSQEFNIYNYFYLLLKSEIILHVGLQPNTLFFSLFQHLFSRALCRVWFHSSVFINKAFFLNVSFSFEGRLTEYYPKVFPSHIEWRHSCQWSWWSGAAHTVEAQVCIGCIMSVPFTEKGQSQPAWCGFLSMFKSWSGWGWQEITFLKYDWLLWVWPPIPQSRLCSYVQLQFIKLKFDSRQELCTKP